MDLINVYCWRITDNGGAWQEGELGCTMSLAGTEIGCDGRWLLPRRGGLQEVAVEDT